MFFEIIENDSFGTFFEKRREQGDMRMVALRALQNKELGIPADRAKFNQEVSRLTHQNFTVQECGAVTVSQLINRFAEFSEYDIFAERVMLKVLSTKFGITILSLKGTGSAFL